MTYQCAFSSSSFESCISCLPPIGRACCEKIDKRPRACSSQLSSFLSTREKRVSIPRRYIEQNVKASFTVYASAIEPSGLALFLTYFFNVPRFLNKQEYYENKNKIFIM